MKISYKILISTITIMAAAFGISGYLFIHYVFTGSMEREIEQAINESSILRFTFETAALNIPSKYEVLKNGTIEQIGANLEKGGEPSRLLRLSDENKNPLYVSDGFVKDMDLLEQMDDEKRIYKVLELDGKYYIQTGTVITSLDRIIYLETMKDVSDVYRERHNSFLFYRRLMLLVLIMSAVLMFFISHLLTNPIRMLTKATKEMASGNYGYRAVEVSEDEMGQLTKDFNRMANELEKTILKLEDELRSREEFIAAFSHELKTPLTAIIGYADLLRSRKLEEEKAFLSANYIYTEGKRLENMAFRLLALTVTKRGEIDRKPVEAEVLFDYLGQQQTAGPGRDYDIRFNYDKAVIFAEADLLKTVLSNLLDNACKASKEGGVIEVTGRKTQDGYRFEIEDHGVGIPEEEIGKITEAFYMVDKSRSRSKNGAGLGLALCAEILKLHGSSLLIESELGKGSRIGFLLKDGEAGADETETI